MDARNSEEAKVSLPSDREIVIVRRFQARKEMVFEAWSKPEHVKRWYVCSTMTMPVCEMDFREGGKWRWVQHDPAQKVDHPLSGEYREIVRADRLIFTERYEPIPGSDHLVTLTFEQHDGFTMFTQNILHGSKEGRDAHLRAGIEQGMSEMFVRFDDVLASIATRERAMAAGK